MSKTEIIYFDVSMNPIKTGEGRMLEFVGVGGQQISPAQELMRINERVQRKIIGEDRETAILEYAWLRGDRWGLNQIVRILSESGYGEAGSRYYMESLKRTVQKGEK